MFKTIPRGGRIYVFEEVICFKSTLIGIKTKMLLKINNIASVKSEKGSSFIPYRITITSKECAEVQLDFYKKQDSVDFARIINSSRNDIRLEKRPVFALERQLTTESAPDHSKLTFNIGTCIIFNTFIYKMSLMIFHYHWNQMDSLQLYQKSCILLV